MKLERRYINHGELRVKGDGNGKKIAGYATKFTPAISEDLGFFREQIDPHAFDACLAANPDVRGLWNHDPNHILGRTTAGTLRLSVDATGLLYEIDPPDTTLARDLMVSMERGDVTQSSFGFICIEDTWREGVNGEYIRTVLKAELFDVSPVTFPAYPDATSGTRATRSMFPEGDEEIQKKLAELRAAKVDKTKMVDGVELHADCFAYVGDPEKTDTWKLPIKFPSDDEKTKSHIQNALARFDQTEGIPDSEKSKVHDKIVAAAKEHGIDTSEEHNNLPEVIAEVRQEAVPAVEADAAQAAETRAEDDCECDCPACVDGDCANCSDPDCDDEDCEMCCMRSARAEAELRSAAELETSRLLLRLRMAKAKSNDF